MRRPLGRIGLVLALLLWGPLWLWPTAFAAEGGVSLQVIQFGWDGHMVPDTLTPVLVKVTGGEADLNVLVEVTSVNEMQTGPTTTIKFPLAAYAQEVALPARAEKEVLLWLPGSYGLNSSVRVVEDGKVLASQDFRSQATKAPFWPLVGYLSADDALGSALNQVELPLQGVPTSVNVSRLRPQVLPASADRLKALRAIVVQGNAAAGLSDEQRVAIQRWVEAGGHLLLAGGPDLALTAGVLPARALPVTFGGTSLSADLTPLAAWAGSSKALANGPVVRLQPQGGTVLAGSAQQPLAWRLPLGAGTITLLAADPSLEPLHSWDGTPALLKRALLPALGEGWGEEKWFAGSQENSAARLLEVVQALPPSAYPGWKQVALYLGGFALLAGPLLHLAFWPVRRRGWIWVAVPAAAVVTAALLYGVGVAAGGRDLMGNMVSLVEIDPEKQVAKQVALAGFYGPSHREISIPVTGDGPLAPADPYRYMRLGMRGVAGKPPEEAPFRLVTGNQTRLEFKGNESAVRAVSLARTLGREVGRVTAELGVEGEAVKGRVTNETPYHLEDAAVVVGYSLYKVGDLAPGQSAEVDMTPNNTANVWRYDLNSLTLQLFGHPLSDAELTRRGMGQRPPGIPVPMELPNQPEVVRRSRMLDVTMEQQRHVGPGPTPMPLMFIAFTADPVGPEFADIGRHPVHHLSLVKQPLRLSLPPGPFTLPSSLVPSEAQFEEIRGMGTTGNEKFMLIEIDSGAAVYTFTPPLPPGAELDLLRLSTRALAIAAGGGPAPPMGMGEPGAAEAGVFEIYNAATATWEPLPAGEEAVLREPAPYVAEGRSVKVRVRANGGRVQFVPPTLQVEGRVKP